MKVNNKIVPEVATELEYLKFFFENCDFGPAHDDVVNFINERFEKQTGKLVQEIK